MTKEKLIQNCCNLIGDEADTARVELFIHSALAFVNGYTFQQYGIENISSIPVDILAIITDLVVMKYQDKGNIVSEKLSDYAVSYGVKDLSDSARIVLNKYVIYCIE